MNINLETVIAGIVLVIVMLSMVWAILRQNFKELQTFVAALNQNTPLQNAIEVLGASVPPTVVNALLGVMNAMLPYANNDPDLAAAVKQLQIFIKTVTDGQPNVNPQEVPPSVSPPLIKPPEGGAVG